MKYVLEQYKWDNFDNFKYFHLVNSKEFELDNEIDSREYSKNGSYFILTAINDEIQGDSAGIRTKSRIRKNVRKTS